MGDRGTRLLAAAWLAALIGGFFALVALSALGDQSCASVTNLGECYPWGTEGPTAGSWLWRSKTNYILGGILPFTVAILVLVNLIPRQDRLNELPRWKAWAILTVIVVPFGVLFI